MQEGKCAGAKWISCHAREGEFAVIDMVLRVCLLVSGGWGSTGDHGEPDNGLEVDAGR